MDVGAPSNFERLRWLYPDEGQLRASFSAQSIADDEIRRTISEGRARYGEVFCPHTATAVRALELLRERGENGPWTIVATAHPAKFESIVEPLVGEPVAVPPGPGRAPVTTIHGRTDVGGIPCIPRPTGRNGRWINGFLPAPAARCIIHLPCGGVAQLGERIVRIDEVVGSIPILSTNKLMKQSRPKLPKQPGVSAFFLASRQLSSIAIPMRTLFANAHYRCRPLCIIRRISRTYAGRSGAQ